MYLFAVITIITFAITFSQNIFKFIPLGSCFTKHHDNPELIEQINAAKATIQELEQSGLGDYAKTIRKLREENKINDLRKKLMKDKQMNLLKGASIDFICGYALRTLLVLSLIIISFKYRSVPVVVFDDRFNFTPFGGIVSFPTGVPNAVSVPFWAMSCNFVFRGLSNVIKRS